MGAYKVTTPPAFEPITLAEVKSWLKIHPDVSEDDDLIRGLITSARTWAEKNTGRMLLAQTVQEVWDNWPIYNQSGLISFDLSVGPLYSSTVTFEYRNDAGTYVTWAASNYTVDDVTEPGRVVVNRNTSLPIYTTAGYPNIIRITYQVGRASVLQLDANVLTAMKLQIALMYENREDMPLGKDGNATARSAWNLLSLSRLSLV